MATTITVRRRRRQQQPPTPPPTAPQPTRTPSPPRMLMPSAGSGGSSGTRRHGGGGGAPAPTHTDVTSGTGYGGGGGVPSGGTVITSRGPTTSPGVAAPTTVPASHAVTPARVAAAAPPAAGEVLARVLQGSPVSGTVLARVLNGLVPNSFNRYLPYEAKLSKRFDVPLPVLLGDINQESHFDAGANSGQAGGITQFTPETAQSYGVKFGTTPSAIKSQLRGQADLLATAKKENGSLRAALGSYYGSSSAILPATTNVRGRAIPSATYPEQILAQAQPYKRALKGVSLGDAGGKSGGPYVSPFSKSKSFTQSRTDEGVDYTGTGAISAIGKAKYLGVGQGPGWASGGGGGSGYGVNYELLKGPKKGKDVFLYEGIAPAGPKLTPGDIIRKGQTIASFTPGGSIEMGWSDPSGAPIAQPNYSEGDVTGAGRRFQRFASKLGAASAPGDAGISGSGSGSPISGGAFVGGGGGAGALGSAVGSSSLTQALSGASVSQQRQIITQLIGGTAGGGGGGGGPYGTSLLQALLPQSPRPGGLANQQDSSQQDPSGALAQALGVPGRPRRRLPGR
jgi:hypothetical protein